MESLPNQLMLLIFLVHIVCLTFQFEYVETTSNHSIRASCIDSEWKSLMAIKGSLIDDGNLLSSWTGRDCCSWDGITCDHLTGVVQKLDLSTPLSESCLGGEIHPSILNLEHLEYLDLSYNNFSGILIPSFLGSLTNLQYLNLLDANFGGEVPPLLGNLSSLQHLCLGESLLTIKTLKWISGLTSLDTLDFSGTNMSECLDWFSSINTLHSLSSLTLKHCGLVDTISPPISYVNLTSLVALDLSENSLNSTLPLWLFNLTTLEILDLSYNNLRGPIPDMLGQLATLTELDIQLNSFSSSLPYSLCNLTTLISMDLSDNQLEGSLPLCLGNLSSLAQLHLRRNTLGGELPSELGNLKQLTELDLSGNYFKCPIPSSFGQLSMIDTLILNDNQLFGTIPPALLNLTELGTLDVSYNSLSGELCGYNLAKLKSLRSLRISKNQFLSCKVSFQWIPPFQLQDLLMDSVFIGTQFPSWLQTQREISWISLKNASISGSLPGWCWTTSANLFYFDLSNNFLTGHVPIFDVNQSIKLQVQSLNLANNRLTGNIPEELCNLQALMVISLANNQLTGKIPTCLGNLRQLGVLDLANNSLSGQIPYTLGNLVGLLVLHLNGNKLFGELPSTLKNLIFLVTFDLGNNQLWGLIPDWIAKEFSNLRFLRLQSNNFHGNISVNLCQLPSLQVLNLGENKLDGSIPACLGNLSMMLSDDSNSDVIFSSFYDESFWSTIKRLDLEYSSNLQYVKSITLAGNNLHGEIPDELMDLESLQNLNMSNNNLSGKIPERIDNLKHLESLDLSVNQLSGTIPQILANIDALSYLNLSFNNLVGPVPSGNHFDTLNDPSIYEGNIGLCGKPLTKSCPNDSSSRENTPATSNHKIDNDADKFEFSWFYSGIGPGFVIGSLGFFGVLHLKKSWRHAYFRFLENVCDKVRVSFVARISRFQRRVT